jgi:hypothetical protein
MIDISAVFGASARPGKKLARVTREPEHYTSDGGRRTAAWAGLPHGPVRAVRRVALADIVYEDR